MAELLSLSLRGSATTAAIQFCFSVIITGLPRFTAFARNDKGGGTGLLRLRYRYAETSVMAELLSLSLRGSATTAAIQICLALLFTGLPRCARNDKKELVDNDVFLLE